MIRSSVIYIIDTRSEHPYPYIRKYIYLAYALQIVINNGVLWVFDEIEEREKYYIDDTTILCS